jgi:hypothetical protein
VGAGSDGGFTKASEPTEIAELVAGLPQYGTVPLMTALPVQYLASRYGVREGPGSARALLSEGF